MAAPVLKRMKLFIISEYEEENLDDRPQTRGQIHTNAVIKPLKLTYIMCRVWNPGSS